MEVNVAKVITKQFQLKLGIVLGKIKSHAELGWSGLPIYNLDEESIPELKKKGYSVNEREDALGIKMHVISW